MLALSTRAQEPFESVKLVNCSSKGVGFVLRRPVLLGEPLLLKLRLHKQPTVLVYTVRHCDPLLHERGCYAIGAEFSGYTADASGADPTGVLVELVGDSAAVQSHTPMS